MRKLTAILLLTIASLFCAIASAYDATVYTFDDPVMEKRYMALTKELRCPKCQNQNLQDSNALQAGDLRREIYNMLMQGKSDIEIVDFMVYRYGDFVLYRPKLNSTTYVLWFAPAMLLVLGVIVILLVVRRKKTSAEKAPLTAEQQAKIAALLNKENKQ